MNLENIVLDEINKINKKLDYLFDDFSKGLLVRIDYSLEAQRLVETKRPLELALIKYKPEVYGEKK